ncbi:two-component system response regulator [Phenylobacterium aquaticum]|uniref:response regulator n=1 Tax=Phenylobacterium aquaticum TaxID=1763816 RepID=UPI0026EFE5F8|nr:response regulator [Phenylobacterium aquaticum]
MAPRLRKVLVIDPAPASARLLGDLLRNISHGEVYIASTNKRGLELAGQVDPQLIFVELNGAGTDGVDFARKFRRSDLVSRQAPIIVVTATATAQSIMAARDAGVHEFLRKPYTAKELVRRLEAVTLRPRDWVEAVQYIGPDRRRFNSDDYTGPLKRRSDSKASTDSQRILQALRIIKAALTALDSDPAQAMRALRAQAGDLQRVAVNISDMSLATEAADLQRCLLASAQRGVLDPAEITGFAAPLLERLPADDANRAKPQSVML